MHCIPKSNTTIDLKDERPDTVSSAIFWIYGWTHYGMTGQTRARLNRATKEVEIREAGKWIKCQPDAHFLFSAV